MLAGLLRWLSPVPRIETFRVCAHCHCIRSQDLASGANRTVIVCLGRYSKALGGSGECVQLQASLS